MKNKISELQSELKNTLIMLRGVSCPRKRGFLCNIIFDIVQNIINELLTKKNGA
jgi:hypothetical protein